ncbi:hypothetical protein NX801_15385 [Streptomyces sp. LP05-1]|uniref:Lipoprotein n=1 Tax=Streptomyces pyxinae TaxID=2970734 RepID=A0ABT2CI78_9ACTN|nr:hypothetical protein [Streptomyces sp. LP05-1]MCS0637020.1 hypothetical protein [Streptomyces sp. LP05-1]
MSDLSRVPDGLHPVPDVWTGRATNRAQWLLAAGGLGCLALAGRLAAAQLWNAAVAVPLLMAVVGLGAAGLLVLFGTLAFVHVELTVDRHGLDVRCGHLGLPRRRIPLAEVVDVAHAALVTPRAWGGWGYRWRPGQGMAVVIRRGEGLVLTLREGRMLTVTVDDAETAVRILRHRLLRHHDHPAPGPGA